MHYCTPPVDSLFKLLVALGVNYADIARRLQVTRAMVTGWHTGHKRMTSQKHMELYAYAVAICRAWGEDTTRPKLRAEILGLKAHVEQVHHVHATFAQHAHDQMTQAAELMRGTSAAALLRGSSAAELMRGTSAVDTLRGVSVAELLRGTPVTEAHMPTITGYQTVIDAAIRTMTLFRARDYLTMHVQAFPLPPAFFEQLLEHAA